MRAQQRKPSIHCPSLGIDHFPLQLPSPWTKWCIVTFLNALTFFCVSLTNQVTESALEQTTESSGPTMCKQTVPPTPFSCKNVHPAQSSSWSPDGVLRWSTNTHGVCRCGCIVIDAVYSGNPLTFLVQSKMRHSIWYHTTHSCHLLDCLDLVPIDQVLQTYVSIVSRRVGEPIHFFTIDITRMRRDELKKTHGGLLTSYLDLARKVPGISESHCLPPSRENRCLHKPHSNKSRHRIKNVCLFETTSFASVEADCASIG